MLNIVQGYQLNNEAQYQQMDALKEKGVIQSDVLKGFSSQIRRTILGISTLYFHCVERGRNS